MAKFKVYEQSDKEISKSNENDYKRKVLFHKGRKFALVLVLVSVVAFAVIGYQIYLKNRVFTEYDVISIAHITQNSDSKYIEFGKNVLRYNMDGIACIEKDNTKVWEIPYRMKYPIVALCGECGAVAAQRGKEIYIFNRTGLIGSITADYPIIDIDVSEHGVVAVSMESDGMNYVNIYECNGELKVESKTSLEGNGYPLDIAISHDGQKLMTSYLDIAGDKLKSSVVFYNFSDVGENYIWNMVGAYDDYYEDTIIPYTAFMNRETACAVGSDRITIFKIKEIPDVQADIMLKKELESYFFNEKYFGLVYNDSDSGGFYEIEIYDMYGQRLLDYKLNRNYKVIEFINDHLLIYNERSCLILSMSGAEVFSYTFDTPVLLLNPISLTNYVMITETTMSEIRLKQ